MDVIFSEARSKACCEKSEEAIVVYGHEPERDKKQEVSRNIEGLNLILSELSMNVT